MSGHAAISLTLFTTTQSPLPVRYPRPSSSSSLLLPPLIHRSLHSALDSEPVSALVDSSARTITVPHPDKITKHDIPLATATADQSAHELTVKVHLVADGTPAERARWVEESLELLSSVKGLAGVDSLLVGFRGIDYKGKKSAASGWGDWGCGTDNPEDAAEGTSSSSSSSETVPDDLAQHVEDTWAALEHLQAGGPGANATGARRLGTLYMPLGMVQRLADRPVPPRINAMDTPDCHHLPKEYSDFAASRGIELWAGGGGLGADPLPAADLHNLLQEFHSHFGSVLPEEVRSAFGSLSAQIPVEDGRWSKTAKPAVQIRWVLGYTLLSSTRNLVADRGYIISADIASI